MEANELSDVASALTLDTPGGSLTFSLDLFNVFLTELDESGGSPPETFELEGELVMVVGSIPREFRIGYESDWQQVVGRSLAVERSGGEHGQHTQSEIDLPGAGPCAILGGILTIESAGPVFEARAPLTGTCSLEVDTPQGRHVLAGTFAVPGATWG